MSITVKFHNFTKNIDSTMRPTGDGASFSCNLNSPSSVINPTISLTGMGNPSEYNYAYISDYNRYYWVKEWTYNAGVWTAFLSVDVLATYKDEISSSTQYVLRSSSQSNGFITDEMYPITDDIVIQTTQFSSKPFWQDLSNGEYVLGVIGAGSGVQMGAVTYYAMSPVAYMDFATRLFSEDEWIQLKKSQTVVVVPDGTGGGDVRTVEYDLNMSQLKTEFNPAQYIVSCKWFPFTPKAGGTGSSIKLGWWSINGGTENVNPIWQQSVTCTIPAHPQIARGYYLHMPPYSRYTLHFPPFGDIPLDGSYFVTDTTLTAKINVDLISGEGVLELSTPKAGVFMRMSAQIGVDISVGQLASQSFQQGINAVGQVVGAAASAVTGNISGAISGVGSAIGSASTHMLPQVTIAGSNGSRAPYGITPTLTSQFMKVVDEDNARLGRPLCKPLTLGSLSGYIMCARPDLDIPGTLAEQDQVITYLQGGFYLE